MIARRQISFVAGNGNILLTPDDRRIGKRPQKFLLRLQFPVNDIQLVMKKGQCLLRIFFWRRIDLDLILAEITVDKGILIIVNLR